MSYYGNYGKGTYKGNYNYGKQQLTVEDVEKLIKAIVVGENEIIPGSIGAIHIKDGSINNAHIQHLAVSDAHIQEAAINRAHIADLAVSSAKIDDLAVTSAKIAESAIKTAHIEDAAIDSAKIANAAIDTAKIQDASITTSKIQDASITDAKIANASIDTAHIKDLAVTNAKIANAAIDSAKIQDAAITTAKIENGAITTALIAQGAIETAQIADGSITDAKIVELTANKITAGTLDVERLRIVGPDSILYELNVNSVGELSASQYTLDGEGITERSITADKIVAKSITAAEIASRTITANEIAVNTITASSGVIADAAITNAKISNLDASKITSGYISADRIEADSITADKIASDSIESRHIKANSISTDKISSLTADKIVFDGHVFGENATFTGELQSVSGTFSGRVKVDSTENLITLEYGIFRSMGKSSDYEVVIDEFGITTTDRSSSTGRTRLRPDELFFYGEEGGGVPHAGISYHPYSGGMTGNMAIYANRGEIIVYPKNWLEINTPDGYGRFGARNETSFHMDTDRARFYMYKPLTVAGVVTGEGGVTVGTIPLTRDGNGRLSTGGNAINVGNIYSYQTYTATTSSAANVVITGDYQLARSTSSIKYKKDIEDLWESEYMKVLQLRPVLYKDKETNADARPDFTRVGLIAEEVHEVEPRLVQYRNLKKKIIDEEGNEVEVLTPFEELEPDGVQYDRIAVYLLPIVRKHEERLRELERMLS